MARLMLSVSGCRGVVGETLSAEVAARFAGCFGSVLRARNPGKRVSVVLGRDGRRGGEMIHAAATAGLLGSGCHVIDLGVAMTPTVAVNTDWHSRELASKGEVGAGMVITASHNPQQWNGLKCLLAEGGIHGAAACAPPASLANEIIAMFERGGNALDGTTMWQSLGSLQRDDEAAETHVERVLAAMQDSGLTDMSSSIGRGIRVAVDCVNASGSKTAPMFLRSIGCDVVEVNTNHSGEKAGLFPHPPEPTAENLSGAGGLCDIVRAHQCHVGFALDPDADRLALIDEQGRYVGEEYTLALSALAILTGRRRDSREADVLVTNLSTSRMLEDVAARFGARVLRTPVGEANVVEVMKRENAIAGGEGNGGTIWPRACYVRDSLAGMGLVVWLLARERKALSAIAASIPSYAIEKRKVDLARKEDAQPAIEKIAKAYANQQVDLRDGAWVNFTTGELAGKAWLHVRASNTEPIMRLIAEAPTVAAARGVLDEVGRVIG